MVKLPFDGSSETIDWRSLNQSNGRHNKISIASIADGGIINITPLVKQVQTSSFVGIQTQHH